MRHSSFPTPSALLLALAACGPKAPPPPPSVPPAVFALRAADATLSPPGFATVMHDSYDVRLLIAISGGPGGPLQILLAPARDDLSQDLCAETTRWDAAHADRDGVFQLQGARLGLSVGGDASALDAVSVSGQLPAAGAPLLLTRVAGRLDTRPFLPMMGDNLPSNTICDVMPTLGPCVPCPEGGSPTCWDLALTGAQAAPVTASVVPRSRAQICADAACATVALCKQ